MTACLSSASPHFWFVKTENCQWFPPHINCLLNFKVVSRSIESCALPTDNLLAGRAGVYLEPVTVTLISWYEWKWTQNYYHFKGLAWQWDNKYAHTTVHRNQMNQPCCLEIWCRKSKKRKFAENLLGTKKLKCLEIIGVLEIYEKGRCLGATPLTD